MKQTLQVVFILLAVSIPVLAHHALASEYDSEKPITLKGKLMEIDWRNPHPYFYVDVEGTNGQMTKWAIVSATPNMLVRFPGGWTRDKVFAKIKDEISVKGWKARDDSNRAYADYLTFSDGSKMQMGIGLTGAE